MDKLRLRLKVNGEAREVLVPVHHTLLEVLREDLGLGTKHGCELGGVRRLHRLLDGEPVLSCLGAAGVGRARDHDGRGPGAGWRAPPAAAGLRRTGRGPVRLLHAGMLLGAQALLATRCPPTRSVRRSRATSAAAPAT